MNLFLLAAAVLLLAAVLAAFGWLLDQSTAHAVGLVAGALLCELIAGLPSVRQVT